MFLTVGLFAFILSCKERGSARSVNAKYEMVNSVIIYDIYLQLAQKGNSFFVMLSVEDGSDK